MYGVALSEGNLLPRVTTNGVLRGARWPENLFISPLLRQRRSRGIPLPNHSHSFDNAAVLGIVGGCEDNEGNVLTHQDAATVRACSGLPTVMLLQREKELEERGRPW